MVQLSTKIIEINTNKQTLLAAILSFTDTTAWMDGRLVGEHMRTDQLPMLCLQLLNSRERAVGAHAAIENSLLRPTALVRYSHALATHRDGGRVADAVCKHGMKSNTGPEGSPALCYFHISCFFLSNIF